MWMTVLLIYFVLSLVTAGALIAACMMAGLVNRERLDVQPYDSIDLSAIGARKPEAVVALRESEFAGARALQPELADSNVMPAAPPAHRTVLST